jgi:hypothetical protein
VASGSLAGSEIFNRAAMARFAPSVQTMIGHPKKCPAPKRGKRMNDNVKITPLSGVVRSWLRESSIF